MKIVMLGNTGVGKTTYMASLFGIMQQRVEGFSLKTTNPSDRSHLLDLGNKISSGNYPGGTSARAEYDFILQHQARDIFPFSWADYRGGAISEKQNSEQASSLVRDLKEADGIMMLCDCQALAHGNTKANEIRRMTTLVSQALRDIERPISLAVILTKTDIVGSFQEKIFSPFQGLIDVINASEWVMGAFIPVACGTKFINVPIPLFFALYSTVLYQALVAQHMAQEYYNRAQQWQQKSQGVEGFFRWVGDKWNGNTTDEELALANMAAAVEAYQKLESIKDPVLALGKYLEKIPVIQQGKTLNDYAEASAKLKIYYRINSSDWF
ncbi:MAG: hypothetical protein HC836_44165 [Richelia sp. RM2_1_2]|nr:hypothetical protein [Richelia sp. RM1_1_1]NJO64876.1 hypothetical protein [Richelia sp. RM2_1_2]